MKQRFLAGMLAILLTISVVFDPIQQTIVQAADANEYESIVEDAQDNIEETVQKRDTEEIEDFTEATETVAEENEAKDTEAKDTEETVDTEESTDETEKVEEHYYIQYLMLNSDRVSLNEEQKVVIGLDCEKEISDAVLRYHDAENGTEYTQKFTDNVDGALLFEMIFQSEEQKGQYELDELTYTIEENTYTEVFEEAGIEATFGVETDTETDPDAYVEMDSESDVDEAISDIDVVRIDENGNTISEDSIGEAIQNVTDDDIETYSIQTADSRAKKDVVVVLDPGHDNTHKGASANGLKEEELNLKIASYCKAELENYSGVKVYMTRDTGNCPHPGTTSGVDNEERVKYAASVGANIYVSIHNNSSTSSSAHGAMVFYPNSNYNPSVGNTGKQLAQVIENHLVALGLANRGITIRDAQVDKYPDGSKADYYGVIRNAKLAGIPAIIIEHAFLTNTGDANDFLKQEGKLKQMGIADAQAIAEYYSLGKSVDITSDGVKVANVNNDAGTALLSAWNVQPVDKVQKVSFAVWSKPDQSDLKWYDVNNTGSTTYAVEMNIKNHKNNIGTYYVDAYAYDIYGSTHYLGGSTITFSLKVTDATVAASANATESQYTITASGISSSATISQVKVAVWSDKNGQDDLIWYPATKSTGNSYSVIVPIVNHKTAGLYYADVYVFSASGQSACVGKTTFKVSDMTAKSIATTNLDNGKGQFDVVVSGVNSKGTVKQIQIPVWSTSDQKDLYWYTAEKDNNGNYIVHVNLANHQYNYGTYYIDAYGTTTSDVQSYLGRTTVKVEAPTATAAVTTDNTEKNYTIRINNAGLSGGIKSMQIAVWSEKGGQDDLMWYTAANKGSGSWQADVAISNHRTSGVYYADAYATNSAGQMVCICRTSFEVSGITAESVMISDKNEDAGQFSIIAKNIKAATGVDTVKVAVWSKEDQSDLYWYTAEKQSGTNYVAKADLKNHQYNAGTYRVDVYGYAKNGVNQCVGRTSVEMKQPKVEVSAAGNSQESQFIVTAKNVHVWGIKGVNIAVWSEKDGQDDLKWYSAKNIADGTWNVSVAISNHKTSGKYFADVYAVNKEGKLIYIGGTNFTVSDMAAKSIATTNLDNGKGQFDVVVSGVNSKGTVKQIQIPVWSTSDQKDLYWYTAEKDNNGNYIVHVNLANHQYNYGTYYIDAYGTTTSDVQSYLGRTTVKVEAPTATAAVTTDNTEKNYTIRINNAGLSGGIKSMQIAVWSEKGGQDDLMWYTAANKGSGSWQADVAISNHRTSGVYYADAYATNSAGQMVCICRTSFEVSGITAESVMISDKNEDAGQFSIIAKNIKAATGVDTVKVAVWSKEDQSDLYWYTAEKQSGTNYVAKADLKNHQYNAGTYRVDVYGFAKNGVSQCVGRTSVEMKKPKILIEAKGNESETQFTVTVSNAEIIGKIKGIQAAVWSEKGGQDDLIWYTMNFQTDSSWKTSVQISRHKTEGLYYVHLYATLADGTSVYLGATTFTVSQPQVKQVSIIDYNESNGTFGVKMAGIYAPAGVDNIQVAVWSTKSQSNLKWYNATKNADGTYQVNADIRNHQNVTGTYYADAYITDKNGVRAYGGGLTCSMVNVNIVSSMCSIMGQTNTIVQQMVSYYNARATYPAFYANTEAPTIEAFCRLYIEESKMENVRAEVAFCQAMKETGFLRYGGNVKIEQYNFAGLGSTGAGVAGASYPDVRTGIRAQIQHLKAYASTDSLKNPCVDGRFSYVDRGCAPYVEWLGQKENPYGKGWATATNYGYDIVNMINVMKTY